MNNYELISRAHNLTKKQIGNTCLCLEPLTDKHAVKCVFFNEIYCSNINMIKKLLDKKIYRAGYTTKEECGVKENEERT